MRQAASSQKQPVVCFSFNSQYKPFEQMHGGVYEIRGSSAHYADYPTWRMWLDAAGYSHVKTEHGLRINNSAAVLQAAIDGQGLELARSVMVKDDLEAGRLIRPFVDQGMNCSLSQAYYVVYRPESGELPKVQAFRDWLLSEVDKASET